MKSKIAILSLLVFLSIIEIGAQETIFKTIQHGDLTREYIVYVPAGYDSSVAVPLMFNFHGYTGQAEGHMNNSNMKPVADAEGFILVYPQGALFFGNTHWNVGAWTLGSTTDDLGFTEAMIDELASTYTIDQDRIYSCGYSNGGYFSFELACQLSHRVAAIGSVGGKMSSQTFNACNPSHPMPIVTIHGTEDNIVTYYGPEPAGSKTINQLNAYWQNYNNTNSSPIVVNVPNVNTFDGSTVEYFSYQNGDNCTVVDHYKVIGGGHDWPGVWGNRDIDASSVIWNFVSKYDINGLIGCMTTTSNEFNLVSSKIHIYPNPSKETVMIEVDLIEKTECDIYSLRGELLKTEIIRPGKNAIDFNDLPSGIYLLKIGHIISKLIKSK